MAKNIRITEKAHALVRRVARRGDIVVDATVGNGRDTRFLAELVGPEGRVIGFDIQTEAAESGVSGLSDRGLVVLHGCGHERMREFLSERVRAVMFNLGYLPGGDKSVITRPETTVAALRQATELLEPGGIVTVVVYTGHEGGAEEGEAVLEFCGGLSREEFSVTRHEEEDAGPGAPFLVAIERRSTQS